MSPPIDPGSQAAIQGGLKAIALTGKAAKRWRNHNEVKALYRHLRKEVGQDPRIREEDRRRIYRRLEDIRVDPIFIGGLKRYVEDADIAPLPLIRERLEQLITLSTGTPNQDVVNLVIEGIEKHVHRAKRTDREAAYHEIHTSEKRIELRIDEGGQALSEQLSAGQEKQLEQGERILGAIETITRPREVSQSPVDRSDPETALTEVARELPLAGAELSRVWREEGPDALGRLVAAPDPWLDQSPPEVWEIAGRLLADRGRASAAELAFRTSVDRGHSDPIRQLVRASRCAEVRRDSREADALVERAREYAQADEHSALLLHDIGKQTDHPHQMLAQLRSLRPTSDAERAEVHALTAQAYLLSEDYEAASGPIAEILSADPEDPRAHELRALQAYLPNEKRFAAGERTNKSSLHEVIGDFQHARDLLRAKHRFRESGLMLTRIAETHVLADDPAAAVRALREPYALAEERVAAGPELAEIALRLAKPWMVEELLADQDDSEIARAFRASAAARGPHEDAARDAVAVLEELLESENGPLRRHAAFSILTASGVHKGIVWDDHAAAILGDAEMQALLRAAYLRRRGKDLEAETELLPYSDRPAALHSLVEIAGANDEWPLAKERAESLVRLEPDGHTRLTLARVLVGAGEREAAADELERIAVDTANSDALRSAAFQRAIELAGEGHDYAAMERTAREWLWAFPGATPASWHRTFALARLSRYEDALQIWTSGALTVTTLDQALLVSDVLYRAADAPTAVREVARLSDQFGREEERLEFLVLLSALRPETQLPEDLRLRVAEGFERFPKQFPDSKLLWVEKAPTTVEELDALAGKYATTDEELVEQLVDATREGEGPISSIAAATGQDIGTVMLRLPFLPLGFSERNLDELELGDAGESLGRSAIWDPSSLFVAGGLGQEIADRIRQAFPNSVISNSTLADADVLTGHLGKPIGHLGYERASGQGRLSGTDADTLEREAACGQGRIELARKLGPLPDFDPDSQAPFDQMLVDGEFPQALATSVSTLAVAKRTRRPIYSDDRYIRLAARREGLKAYGTVAVLEALVARGLLTDAERQGARSRMLASGAWGLRASSDELVRIQEAADWDITRQVRTALTDRGAWRNDILQMWERVGSFLEEAYNREPRDNDRWVVRVIDAIDTAAPEIPPVQRVHSMLVVAWQIDQFPPSNSDAFFRAVLDALRGLPPYLRGLPPIDLPLFTMDQVLAAFSAEAIGEDDRRALFLRMTKRLSALDSIRALSAFVLPPRPPPAPSPK